MKFKSLIALTAVLTLTACGGVDPNSPQGQRQAIFKEMLKVSENLGGMLRGRIAFDETRFAEGAVQLDKLSHEPWKHFPQVREEGGDTRAKDDVWQRQERFQELARNMEASTAELVAATQNKPLREQALVAPVKRVEDACKACHEEFRAY
ncbi:cytochrome c [Ectopseudomonas mendocina]|uniref:Cytochrome c n=1 Tax=Ectopseudomonas mendocina TaxID=300 RepID=A0ABZ2REE0_ECTME